MESIKNDIEDFTDKHFPGQGRHEEIVLYTRCHPIVLLPHVLGFTASLIIFPMMIYTLKSFATEPGSIVFSALFLLLFMIYTYYLHRFFLRLLNYYLCITIMTNFRIISLHKTVFFIDTKDTIDLHKIQDLKKDQNGLLSTLFNYGTLVIEISAIHETKRIMCIPHPEQWFQALNEAKRIYIDKRREKKTLGIKSDEKEIFEQSDHKFVPHETLNIV